MVNQICNNSIDYSTQAGEKILPFKFTLNLQESVLTPPVGETQVFCYDIVGVGEDIPTQADLSHFLLGICDTITEDKIYSISVIVDGVQKPVLWGENVEIKTVEKPDPPTGCVGLKFDFGLNKVSGVMKVCIALKEVYAVGSINVCLYGGGVTHTGLTICGPVCDGAGGCEGKFYQTETVCVPVTVKPYAVPTDVKTICCGKPIIYPGEYNCDEMDKECKFTIRQQLCVEIDLKFGADVNTGEASIDCGEVKTDGCDCK